MAVLTGTKYNNYLQGTVEDDSIFGLGGDDYVVGSPGADVMDGGTGIDTLTYGGADSGVFASLLAGKGGLSFAAGDTFVNFENLEGSTYSDILEGDNGANHIWGHKGNDVIYGRGGNDVLEGGDGNDTIFGGAGGDWLHGGAGVDTLSYADATGGVSLLLSMAYGLGGAAGSDNYDGFENATGSDYLDFIAGDQNANVLKGEGGNDQLDGQGGNDTVFGGDGDDYLQGGGGADTIIGGDGTDALTYVMSPSAVQVDLKAAAMSGGDAQGDQLAQIEFVIGSLHGDTLKGDDGFNLLSGGVGDDTVVGRGGNDNLRGDTGDDTIDGGTGRDVLYGGDGADSLHGGLDADKLEGGAGADTYVYAFTFESEAGPFFDEIGGWDSGDVIDLSVIDADLTLAGNQAFVIDKGAPDTGELRIKAFDGYADITVNTDADASLEMRIRIHTDMQVTAADFLL